MTDRRQAHETGDAYLQFLDDISKEDADGLRRAQESYGNSWKECGGVGAYIVGLRRKIDRLRHQVEQVKPGAPQYDIFAHVWIDPRAEGVIDDIRDLRRYLLLVEAELRAQGFQAKHRDNT